jgi:hypothetical protein
MEWAVPRNKSLKPGKSLTAPDPQLVLPNAQLDGQRRRCRCFWGLLISSAGIGNPIRVSAGHACTGDALAFGGSR